MAFVPGMPFVGGASSRYRINQSLRFRASNSATLNRTLTSTTNRRTFTFAFWVKRGTLGGTQLIFNASSGTSGDSNWFGINWGGVGGNSLVVTTWATNMRTTTRDFRDPSAWYHVVVAVDTTQATAANRVRVYVNGVEETSFSTNNNVAQNTDLAVNDSAAGHRWGRRNDAAIEFFDGYLSDVYFIDGQALTPSSFGQTDPATNSWVPRRYTGTYGTNGFYLPFSDATTTTTISQDRSGNGNNWTSSGISVTAGATFDQMADTPTSNHAVVNSIGTRVTATSAVALDNANMRVTTNTSAFSNSYWPLTITPQGGAYHIETIWSGQTVQNGNAALCLWRSDTIQSGVSDINYFPTAVGVSYQSNGNRTLNGASAAYGATWTAGDRITMEWDTATGNVTFFKNGVSQGTITNAIPPGVFYTPVIYTFNNSDPRTPSFTLNCGQQPFVDTPTTGFVALNTANLSTPVIPRGDDAFAVNLYTGNGGAQTVDNGRFQPDLIWGKSRSAANWHGLWDAVRGGNNLLYSNATDAEASATNLNMTRTATGFSVNGANSSFNPNGVTQVAWSWREGAAYGFDIVTYTGSGANRTIAHGLNAVPHMMIVKDRTTGVNNWPVYHRNASATPATVHLRLNQTTANTTDSTVWNDTAPTSSVFSVGTNGATNGNTNNFVAYLWTSIPGFSLFGSYTGNGSADGPFVWCGFRPRFVMVKAASNTGWWSIYDAAREPNNQLSALLGAQTSNAEASSVLGDFTANGFKLRSTNLDSNGSGYNIIFAAFAENPFKFANAR